VENRTRKSPDSFGRHDGALFNSLLGDGYSDPYGANVVDDPASGAANSRTDPNFGGSQTGVFAGILTHF
jgi:hypothetical protein